MINVNRVDYLLDDPPVIKEERAVATQDLPKTVHIIVQIDSIDPDNYNNQLSGSLVLEVPKGANDEIIQQKIAKKININWRG